MKIPYALIFDSIYEILKFALVLTAIYFIYKGATIHAILLFVVYIMAVLHSLAKRDFKRVVAEWKYYFDRRKDNENRKNKAPKIWE